MMKNRYKWVLFDADHTLFDFDKASEEALSEVFQVHNIEWRNDMYPEYKRINLQCWWEHESGLIDRDTLVYERFRRYFDFMQLSLDPVSTHLQYLENLSQKPYPMPGANEIISALHGRKRLGYITNGMTRVQRIRLEKAGWHNHFDVIVIAGEIGVSKPYEAYFNHVQMKMGNPEKKEVLVVGDSLTADIAGARDYGYATCWYNPDGNQCTLSIQPDHMIAHLDELTPIVLE